jgi:hypothetical protein
MATRRGSAEAIAWGFRKLLEQEAQAQPLVCVLDDLHWAEETLFDLVEHVADLARDAPILLLCMARPELLERRPSWGGGKWNATTVLLEPLDARETEQLLTELGEVPAELRERIVQVAEGNPLFLEEMLALVRDSGGGQVEVPPTIQALLAATGPARRVGARSARAGLDRGSHLPSRRRFRPHRRGRLPRPAAGGARTQGARPSRPRAAARGRRLPLPPPPDPGCHL